MTSATDVLRRMLDERGVEYRIDDAKTVMATKWDYGEHSSAMFTEYDDGECVFVTSRHTWTPEQAIAATLGATDARPTQEESSETCHDVWDVELTGRLRFQCSECGAVSLEITPRFCPACGRKVVEPTTNGVDAEVEQ